MNATRARIPLPYALHIQSAEFWLKLGQTSESLHELAQLPDDARQHPWAVQTLSLATIQADALHSAPTLPLTSDL